MELFVILEEKEDYFYVITKPAAEKDILKIFEGLAFISPDTIFTVEPLADARKLPKLIGKEYLDCPLQLTSIIYQ
jgi:hypothetical protein